MDRDTEHPLHVLDTTGSDLHAEAARLRARGPATLVELPGPVRAWSVTRHDVIKRLTADPRVSRDPYRHWPEVHQVPEGWPLSAFVLVHNAFNSYGSEHRRLRRLLGASLTPRRTEALRPMVRDLVARLLRELAAVPPGEVVDLRPRYAYRIPTEVICELFGVPEDMRDWARRVVGTAAATDVGPEEAGANYQDMFACMSTLVAVKRQAAGEDMTSDLLAAGLPEDELVVTLMLMIGAGSETAVNLIASAVHALLTLPEQRALLAGSTVTWDDVIEETLRVEGPIMHIPLRYAVEDIDLGEGVVIRRGEPLILAFGAAGRDPALHGDSAGEFDAARPHKEHLAFGHGAHYCLGAPLARLEASLALPALFDAFPDMALAEPPRAIPRQRSFIVNGLARLPVVLRP